MTGLIKKITNSLSFRIIAPVIIVVMVTGFSLYFFVRSVASDFVYRIIKENLERMSSGVYNIIDDSLNDLLKEGGGSDEKAVMIKKALTLALIEDFMRQNDLEGSVLEDGRSVMMSEKVSLEFSEVLEKTAPDRALVPVTYKGNRYYSYHFGFEPWNWHIYLIKDAAGFSSLMYEVRVAYTLTGIVLLMAMTLLIVYFNKTFKNPLSRIIDPVKKGLKPEYKGIQELEFLSDNLSHLIDSLRAEKAALFESEEKFSVITATAADAVIVTDSAGRITYWNPAAEKIFGYAPQEALGRELHALIAPERYREDYLEGFERIGTPGQGRATDSRLELVALRKDGTEFPIEVSASAIKLKGQWHAMGIVRDISERKQAEEALLRRSHQLEILTRISQEINTVLEIHTVMRTMVASAMDLVEASAGTSGLLIDGEMTFTEYHRDGVIHPINHKFEKGRGVPGWVMETMKPYTVDDADHDPHIVPEIRKSLGFYNLVDVPILSRKGELLGCLEIYDKKGKRPFNVNDITMLQGLSASAAVALENAQMLIERKRAEEERIRLEAQLRHAQKMEAVGQLAGGVAHDFNNILTVIIGCGTLILMKMDARDPFRLYMEQILSSARRAAALTRSLLAFSRKQVLNLRILNLNEVVRNVAQLLLRLVGEDIELNIRLAEDDLIVMADSGQIEQVLMNLVTNARDSMSHGGSLAISTRACQLGSELRTKYGYGRSEMYACISVTDTGVGMDEQTRERIFEPFFTTKELGRGTGLGLSIVYGIIKQHSGHIDVQSELGKGAIFNVYLPLVESRIEQTPLTESAVLLGRGETVLVAEDDPEVRGVTKSLLEEFGYKVEEAVDGEDVLRKVKEGPDSIQVVIMDVIMPKMNGLETYEQLKKLAPAVKAIFMSGYTAEILNKRGILGRDLNLISKPISPEELLRKVAEALGR